MTPSLYGSLLASKAKTNFNCNVMFLSLYFDLTFLSFCFFFSWFFWKRVDLELKFMLIDQRVYYYRKGSKQFYGGKATRATKC